MPKRAFRRHRVTQSSAHRFLHERADPCLFGGGQLLQREGGRPHGAFVEVRLVHEAERRVPRLEFLRALEEADDLAVLGIRGHPVPESRREGWRAGFDDRMEPLAQGAIRFRHRGDLREHGAFPVRLVRARAAAPLRLQLLEPSLIASRSSSGIPWTSCRSRWCSWRTSACPSLQPLFIPFRQAGGYRGPLEPAGPCQWRIPKSYRADMRVDGIIFADDTLIEQIKKDQGPEQVVNVATLPGIQKASLAMPDIHWGYGFCIGGVAATDPEEGGVISPGGVGYDINCGVRLLRTNLVWSEVKDRIKPLVDQLFRDIPTGVGQSGRYLFDKPKLTRLMAEGASYVVELGYGTDHDLLVTEAGGCLDGADPGRVSDRAITRGYDQCGTLGSGNHFLEVQVVDRVLDRGLRPRSWACTKARSPS